MTDAIAICVFDGGDLRRRPQRGTMQKIEWRHLSQLCASPVVTPDKASEGGLTLADLRAGVRRNSHVVTVSALAVDYDVGALEPRAACLALSVYRHIVYSTASHMPDAPRWRAIVALARPTTATEYRDVWRLFAGVVEPAGIKLDKTKDACRLWYAPTIRTLDSEFYWCACEGRALDVDRLVAEARRRREREQKQEPAPSAPRHRDRYVASALRCALAALAGADEGDRHATLRDEAFSLARLGLDAGEIAAALMPTWIGKTGRDREAEGRRTIRDAVRARGGAA